jgi:hypothetical protein
LDARRRRLPRQQADWHGTYTVERDPIGTWGACEILDISILGIGVELFEGPDLSVGSADELIGCRILVQVQTPAGASVTLQMGGEIRYVAKGSRGGTRVGVSFIDLSETEQAILNVLEQMQAVW